MDPGEPEAKEPPSVVVAVGGDIRGDRALAQALRSEVIEPVLHRFGIEPGPTAARKEIEHAPIVIAELSGAPPEVLLSIGRRQGGAVGPTVLFAPEGRAPAGEQTLCYPPNADAIASEGEQLRTALCKALVGDPDSMVAEVQAALDQLKGSGRVKRLRQIVGASRLGRPRALLRALGRGFLALGAWADLVALLDEAAAAGGEVDYSRLPKDLLETYAVGLNREGRADEALAVTDFSLAAGEETSELRAVRGRIFKDRWDKGGKTAVPALNRSIKEYRQGFQLDGNYYPGINSLILMVFSGERGEDAADLAREVRASLERGRNPDEHPWWHLATRLQLEIVRLFLGVGDPAVVDRTLDELLAQRAEQWMRESTAGDIGRLAELGNEDSPTALDELEDSEFVRNVLDVRQAVLRGSREAGHGVQGHCVLEMTRRGEDRWITFTDATPCPLFCRSRSDDGTLHLGNPLMRLQSPASSERQRKNAIANIGQQLRTGFAGYEIAGSLTDRIRSFPGEFLVLQVDARTAVEPWELLAEESGQIFSLDTSFGRRLLLESRRPRRRSLRSRRKALVVGDPRDDLHAARDEATAVSELLEGSREFAGVRLLLGSDEATTDRVAEELDGGGVDLLHYAGHAQEREGLQLADGMLNPGHLSGRASIPAMVVANACSTGTLYSNEHQPTFVRELTTVGVDVFIGCAWPVGDRQARCFSAAFYSHVLDAQPVGDAVRAARRAIRSNSAFGPSDPYWASYVLYGDPWYRFIDTTD